VLQKARTRDALVAATRQLMRAGVTPAVEQAADVTRVSRTTAYRYFSSQRAPRRHVPAPRGLLAAGRRPARRCPYPGRALRREDDPVDPRERGWDAGAMLRLSLEPQVPLHEVALRQGQRTIWVADALARCSARWRKRASS